MIVTREAIEHAIASARSHAKEQAHAWARRSGSWQWTGCHVVHECRPCEWSLDIAMMRGPYDRVRPNTCTAHEAMAEALQ